MFLLYSVNMKNDILDVETLDLSMLAATLNKLSNNDAESFIVNRVKGHYGIECIRSPIGEFRPYWGDAVALYMHMGDTYTPAGSVG